MTRILAEVCFSVKAIAFKTTEDRGGFPAGGPDTLTRCEVFELAFAAQDKKGPISSPAPAWDAWGLMGTPDASVCAAAWRN
jgi:hypothetical protein